MNDFEITTEKIFTVEIPTPIGKMVAAARESGILMLVFSEQHPRESHVQGDEHLEKEPENPCDLPVLKSLCEELHAYFEGKLQAFDLPLHPAGTTFQQKVWAHLQTIPYGESRSYQQLSHELGRPSAIRAIARANADNPIVILIPCHRVIGSDGRLTGYAGGLWRKQFLLELEGALPHKDKQPRLF